MRVHGSPSIYVFDAEEKERRKIELGYVDKNSQGDGDPIRSDPIRSNDSCGIVCISLALKADLCVRACSVYITG